MKSKYKIVITNDDGIDSKGLITLSKKMMEIGDITIFAPDQQQSAVSNALTIQRPLRVKKTHSDDRFLGYAINGTPADCVKLALNELIDYKPDLLISGINHGQNTSINILYSGTVSGAAEGMLLGIPSIAVSIDTHDPNADCSFAAEITSHIAGKILENGLPTGTFLNINVPNLPATEVKGIKITKQGENIWKDRYDYRTDPWGRDYYWFAGSIEDDDTNEDSDLKALKEGYISVTPVKLDFTNYSATTQLKYLEGQYGT